MALEPARQPGPSSPLRRNRGRGTARRLGLGLGFGLGAAGGLLIFASCSGQPSSSEPAHDTLAHSDRQAPQGDHANTPLPGAANLANAQQPASTEQSAFPNVHRFELLRIDGSSQSMDAYRGKVLLIVNTASECGLTGQYEGLQALHERFADRGLVVLGFPANNFMGQEPGTNEQIAKFCRERFNVTFPMFAKLDVIGPGQHPMFAELSRVGGPPSWNFTKYLVDRQGVVLERFGPRAEPLGEEITSRVDAMLGR